MLYLLTIHPISHPLSAIPFTPPTTIKLFGFLPISTHGLMFLLGSLVCYYWTRYQAAPPVRHHYDDALPWVTMSAIGGARICYALVNPELFRTPLEILQVWHGGLVSYGGFIGATLAWLIYLKQHNLDVQTMTEPLAVPALVGWGIGRIGCFLSWYGEYGIPTTVPWAFTVDGVARHPVMLYQAIGLITAGFMVKKISSKFRLSPTGASLCAYSLVRFGADFYRYWYPHKLQYYSQTTCVILALWGATILYLWSPSRRHENSTPSP